MVGMPGRNLDQIRSAILYLISNQNELSQTIASSALIDLCTHVERIKEDIQRLKSDQNSRPKEQAIPNKLPKSRSIPKKLNKVTRK